MINEEIINYIKENFKNASVSIISDDGFPVSFPVSFEIKGNKIILKIPSYLEEKLINKKNAVLLFNNIKVLPSGGYTDRKYLGFIGEVIKENNQVFFIIKKQYGWDENKIPFFQLCEMNVGKAKRYLNILSIEKGIKIKPYISPFWLFFRTVRFPFVIASILPSILGILLAVNEGFFNFYLAFLTVLGVLLIHLALNVHNDYWDFVANADNINITPTPFSGGSRIIQYGILSPQTIHVFSLFLYASGIIIGIYLALLRGLIEILAIMGIGVFLAYFYNAKPFRFSSTVFAETSIGIGFGPIIVLGSYFVQTQSISLYTLLASVPIGIFVALIAYVNFIPDRKWDIEAGKRNLVSRLSLKGIIKGYYFASFLAFSLHVLCVILGIFPILSLISLILIKDVFKVARIIKDYFGKPYELIPAMAKNINLYTKYALITILSLILNLFFPFNI